MRGWRSRRPCSMEAIVSGPVPRTRHETFLWDLLSNFGPILDGLAAVHTVVGVDHPGTGTTPRATRPLELAFARVGRWLGLITDLWSELARREETEPLARLLVPLTLSPQVLEGLTGEQVEAAVRATAASFPPGGGDHAALVRGADLRAEIARLDVLALVIATTADRLVPLDVQREVADALPGARWAELPTGHLPFAELPREWADLVTGFLAALPTRRA
ncbi:alpha/beta hydrolase [Streptomyces sp. NBC_00435]|uniref:alpha/beta fold hydrolase n=1 Tax=Streptomyces sp. NBC_00435 TaxID=2903649 RepID=UPI002E1ED3E2